MPIIKNKFRYFTVYKWGAITCFLLSIVFLFVGITQSMSGGSVIDALKPDFGNLSKDKPVSVVLQEAENIGVEYTARTGRRSTTTYNYFVIKTHDKKLILETDDKNDVKKSANINIKINISATTAENQNNIKTLAVKNINENTKLSEQELLDIKFVTHYTDSDKLGSDYWGWIAFVVFLVCTGVFGIRYWWDRRNYKIAMEDIKESASFGQNNNQKTNYLQELEKNSRNYQENNANKPNSNFGNNENNNFLRNSSNKNTEQNNLPNLSNNKNYEQNNLPNNNHQNYTSQNSNYSNYDQNSFSSNNFPQNQTKSGKITYILLAIFLGIFGVHHFYNHKILFGFLHLIWLICFVIPFFAIEQLALIFLLSFVLLAITFVASLVQALARSLSKE